MTTIQIVGVLNVTPNSFHDGGKYVNVPSALTQVEKMLKDGADVIEIGGESTGPNSPDVGVDIERERVLPVLRAIRETFPKTRLSVDTYKNVIAEEAIAAGATMINDVTAGRSDPRLLHVLARHPEVSLVLMYAKDASPRTSIADTAYDDVVTTVKAFLEERKAAAVAAGVSAHKIILDPGLGHFVSSAPSPSQAIIARLREFASLGSPLFLSPSRKSFVAGSEKLTTADRLPGTIAASAIAVLHGASYIRTHDVLEVRRACEIALAIRQEIPNPESQIPK
jgi:dihydropteroate synthase